MYVSYISTAYVEDNTMETLSISKAREGLREALGRVEFGGERIALTNREKVVAVVISPDDARRLELLEDRIDGLLALEAKARAEAVGEAPIPWSEAKKLLNDE